nr:hypothetical protein [uncultured Roseibium sp.]
MPDRLDKNERGAITIYVRIFQDFTGKLARICRRDRFVTKPCPVSGILPALKRISVTREKKIAQIAAMQNSQQTERI